MAGIAFRNSSSADIASATSTVNITLPTGTLATDLVVVTFGNDYSSVTAESTTAPAGWTAIGTSQAIANGGVNEHVRGYCFYAPGTIANLGFSNSQTGSNYQQGWVASAYSGVNLNDPIDVGGSNSNIIDSTTLTTNALSILTAGALHLIAVSDWKGGIFSATNFINVENGATNASASLMYNATGQSIGSTGTVVVTSSATGASQIIIATSFALKPLLNNYVSLERNIRGLNRGLCQTAFN